MKSHIEDYFLRICSVLQARNDNRAMAVVLQVRAYLDEKYALPDLPLESMADQVHLSAGYLGMLFKKTYGMTPTQFRKKNS